MNKTIVGTTIVKKSAYALNAFLANQKETQIKNQDTELIIATDEIDFLGELKEYLEKHKLKGEVIYYETEKPEYAKDNRIWSMTAGREAIRKYVLERRDVDWLLSVDADMVFDSNSINILKDKVNGRTVAQSGYVLRDINTIGFSLGCTLIKREVLERIKFRCLEFKNGQVIEEGNMFEYDLIKQGIKIVKGLFLEIKHYYNNNDFVLTCSRQLPLSKLISTHSLLRYWLIGASILFKHDISRAVFNIIYSNSFIQILKEIEGVESR